MIKSLATATTTITVRVQLQINRVHVGNKNYYSCPV